MMQTFLPYPDFYKSAQVLDYRRLGKQRVECLQILRALLNSDYGWQNHPAVRMWHGYERSLCEYADAICAEWRKRHYADRIRPQICQIDARLELDGLSITLPYWLGNEAFHSSHRAALLAKDLEHYSQFGWSEEPGVAYVWPK